MGTASIITGPVVALCALLAAGAPGDSIRFSAASSATGWRGIRFFAIAAGNMAQRDGGGVFCQDGATTLTSNVIVNNTATR